MTGPNTATTPLYATGKICYLEIPAIDVARSAEFYRQAFGWSIRSHSNGSVAFDDTVGGVSGMWVPGRSPSGEPGLMVSVMVASATRSIEAIVAAGGQTVRPVDESVTEKLAWFRDPAGNVLGIYQQPGLAETEGAPASDHP